MKELNVFLDLKELLTFRKKRAIAVSLVVLGVLSIGLLFLPLTLRLFYFGAFTVLTEIVVLSTVNTVASPVITQIKVSLYNRKNKPRVEVRPKVKELAERMGIEHSGEISITSCPSINNAYVNLYTKKITISESWINQFHETEVLATLGHELGHIKGERRFTIELLSVLVASMGFATGLIIVAALFRLFLVPIFIQVTTLTLAMLMLSVVLWRNEYRADKYGAEATSPEALIAVFEGLQGMQKSNGKKDEGSETHPPLHSRIKRLERMFEATP